MRTALTVLAWFVACAVNAQEEHALLKEEFRNWLAAEIESGFYWPDTTCNPDYIREHGYPEDRIGERFAPVGVYEPDLVYVYADVDGDGVTDQFVSFLPHLCDGGNAIMGQTVVLTVFVDGRYRTLSTDEGLFAELEADPERSIWYDGIGNGRVYAHYVRMNEEMYGLIDEESVVFDYATGKVIE